MLSSGRMGAGVGGAVTGCRGRRSDEDGGFGEEFDGSGFGVEFHGAGDGGGVFLVREGDAGDLRVEGAGDEGAEEGWGGGVALGR